MTEASSWEATAVARPGWKIKMKASQINVVLAAVVLVVLLGYEAEVSMAAAAVTCNHSQLDSCAHPILFGTPPSKLCCTKMKQQKPCFCKYVKDPSLKKYIKSPNAKKTAKTCGVPVPKC
ncbi:hypothetical protein RHSIM_RhsimUnG0075900 [Rhododendron simsii]|uniref:Bifunctional inhibitor/plant lipid transfer protein/seed storage helical domain-containing protein n=1 Tax=Rhododendron simsii TaxID=118357 RepID=A0A834FVX8_RHOSS|nr:hypothetical protein RHSIM_RhsimUnG0075900 [Rhododendron simsii]